MGGGEEGMKGGGKRGGGEEGWRGGGEEERVCYQGSIFPSGSINQSCSNFFVLEKLNLNFIGS